MEVVVKKKALIQALIESIAGNTGREEPEFTRISMEDIEAEEAEAAGEPIRPVELMSTQLAEEMPPVEDPEFIPASSEVLGRAAYVISKEVPDTEIEYFYRSLHKLLDSALDRESDKNMKIESDENMKIEVVQSVTQHLLEASDVQGSLLKIAIKNINDGADLSDEIDELSKKSQFYDVDKNEILDMLTSAIYEMPDDDSDADLSNADSTPEEEDLGDDSDDTDDYDDSDEDISLVSTSSSAIEDNIIEKMNDKKMFYVPWKDPESGEVMTQPMLGFSTVDGNIELQNVNAKRRAFKDEGIAVLERALEDEQILQMFNSLVDSSPESSLSRSDKKKFALIALLGKLQDELATLPMGPDGSPGGNAITDNDFAIMSANLFADTVAKDMGVESYDLTGELSKSLLDAATFVKEKGEDVPANIGTGSDMISRVVSAEVYSNALEAVAEKRRTKPKRKMRATRPDSDSEVMRTPEEMMKIEAADIKKNMRKLTKMANLFDKAGASGVRQWMRKYALPAYTAMLGDLQGYKSWEGYHEELQDYMSALLDEFMKAAPKYKETAKKLVSQGNSGISDSELKNMIETIDDLAKDFEELSASRLQDEDEFIDYEALLKTDGGMVLRNALNDLVKHEDFMEYAASMRSNMKEYIGSLEGVDKSGVDKFSKMFNGEVELVGPTELSKIYKMIKSGNAEEAKKNSPKIVKLIDLGITPDVYSKSAKQAEKLTREWFTGARKKLRQQKVKDKLINKKINIFELLEDAIATTQEDLAREEQILKKSIPDTKD